MASIASDDALILPQRANLHGWNFRERQPAGLCKRILLRWVNYLEGRNVGEVYLEGELLGLRLDASGRRRNTTMLGNVIEAPIRGAQAAAG
jgi:hypothetical protein